MADERVAKLCEEIGLGRRTDVILLSVGHVVHGRAIYLLRI